MPIYAYRCAACGHTQDVLRKMSDPPLADCPACAKPRFEKQVTAAGFQLKGSGWYVTDFRNPASAPAKGAADKPTDDKPAIEKGNAAAAPASGSAPAADASAPAAAPASAVVAKPAAKPAAGTAGDAT